jgi:hypothetical protein
LTLGSLERYAFNAAVKTSERSKLAQAGLFQPLGLGYAQGFAPPLWSVFRGRTLIGVAHPTARYQPSRW